VQTVFDVRLADDALPLVKRIIADIALGKSRLLAAQTQRRALAVPASGTSAGRQRFLLDDEIRERRTQLRQVIDELHHVGATLLDPIRGEVGFPSIVNGSLAYLVYRAGEDRVNYWRYRDQAKLRPVPGHWRSTGAVSRLEEEEGLLVS
jgi:hypothetical protein